MTIIIINKQPLNCDCLFITFYIIFFNLTVMPIVIRPISLVNSIFRMFVFEIFRTTTLSFIGLFSVRILTLTILTPNLFLEKRSISLASSVILSFLIHTECIPASRTENILLGNIMHTNRNSKH